MYSDPTPEPVEGPLGPVTWSPLTKDELNYIWIHNDDIETRMNYRQSDSAFFTEYLSYVVDRDLYKGDAGTCYWFPTFYARLLGIQDHRDSLLQSAEVM